MPLLIPAIPRACLARRLALGSRVLAFALGAATALPVYAAPAASAARATELKAVFVFNFTIFVQWPAAAMPPPGEPFRIGVLGDAGMADALKQVVRGEHTHDHSITVQQSARAADLLGCQLVFVGSGAETQASDLLSHCRAKPILTIGETASFTHAGGNIRLYVEHNQLRMEINPTSFARQELKPSSKLLRAARLMKE